MKKFALLIGNSRNLPGTSKDILDFQVHLMSDHGGAWEQAEIKPLIDMSSSEIEKVLNRVKANNYDYVIVYFTGHGGCKDGTIMEVNPQNELMSESLFLGLAPKQLNIFDCCRAWVRGDIPIDEDHTSANQKLRELIRKEYDDLIDSAAPQQVRIYSCREGETSYPLTDGRGSIYTQTFLDAAKELRQSVEIVRIYDCHERAAQMTIQIAMNNKVAQNPEIIPAKCLHVLELPISFNPICLKSQVI